MAENKPKGQPAQGQAAAEPKGQTGPPAAAPRDQVRQAQQAPQPDQARQVQESGQAREGSPQGEQGPVQAAAGPAGAARPNPTNPAGPRVPGAPETGNVTGDFVGRPEGVARPGDPPGRPAQGQRTPDAGLPETYADEESLMGGPRSGDPGESAADAFRPQRGRPGPTRGGVGPAQAGGPAQSEQVSLQVEALAQAMVIAQETRARRDAELARTPGMDETIPGGCYLIGRDVVDAHGRILEDRTLARAARSRDGMAAVKEEHGRRQAFAARAAGAGAAPGAPEDEDDEEE